MRAVNCLTQGYLRGGATYLSVICVTCFGYRQHFSPPKIAHISHDSYHHQYLQSAGILLH